MTKHAFPPCPSPFLPPFLRFFFKVNRNRLVLVIDGLDHLDERGDASNMLWFPHTLPANVKAIVSTCDGPFFSVLSRRGVQVCCCSG